MTIRTLILALMLAASTATLHLQIPFPTGIDCTGPDKPAECHLRADVQAREREEQRKKDEARKKIEHAGK